MKKLLMLGLAALIAAPSLVVFGESHPEGRDRGDIIQFNNLAVQSVTGTSAPATIIASRYELYARQTKKEGGDASATPSAERETTTLCRRFENPDSQISIQTSCPTPISPVVPEPPGTPPIPSYRIQVDTDTILLLRNRERASLADFSLGDRMNVFGFYNEDGAIRGLIVRNLSKPLEKQFIQLNNVEVIGILESEPKTFVVVQRPDFPCHIFEGERKREFPCPLGLRSEDVVNRVQKIPESIRPQLEYVRKYEVRLATKTIILDREKNRTSAETIAVGDKLNVYGSFSRGNTEVVEAEIIRNLSKPFKKETRRVDGVIAQMNEADGSFVLRTRSGELITVTNPFQVGAFVSIKGTYDELKKRVEELVEIVFRKLTEKDAIPLILQVSPGSGPVGTRVTLQGSGFTRTGNHINFAGVQRAVPNLSSPDGKTLQFSVPATPCSPGIVCAQVVLRPGSYDISVTNENGTSNTATFQVGELPPLSISTPSLPQVVQNQRYEFQINAQGGMGNWDWRITNGSPPPGITLVNAQCAAFPCRVPATISGIPPTPGSYAFTVTLTSGAETVSREFTLVVVQAINTGY